MSMKHQTETEYDIDFVKWTKTQVKLLRKGDLQHLDIENLIEEIEALGKRDRRALKSQTVILLIHLLKQKYQNEKQKTSNSWQNSITNASIEIQYLLEDSPSLKNDLMKFFPQAYEDARQKAAIETGLKITLFPEQCPWDIKEILSFLKTKK